MNDFEKWYNQWRQEMVDNICKAMDDYAKEFVETKWMCILDWK